MASRHHDIDSLDTCRASRREKAKASGPSFGELDTGDAIVPSNNGLGRGGAVAGVLDLKHMAQESLK